MIAFDLFNDFPIRDAVEEIRQQRGVARIPEFLLDHTRLELLRELNGLTWMPVPKQRGVYRTGEHFYGVINFPDNCLVRHVGATLETLLNEKLATCDPNPLAQMLRFSDVTAQRYDPSSLGVEPHIDGDTRINIIALLVIEGEGEFCLCDDHEWSNALSVPNVPGDLLLMRGPGFDSSDFQPMHGIRDIKTQRTTIGFRHNTRRI